MKILANAQVRHFAMIYRDPFSTAVQGVLMRNLPHMPDARNGMLASGPGQGRNVHWVIEATIIDTYADQIVAEFQAAVSDSAPYSPDEFAAIGKANARLMSRLTSSWP